MHNFTYSLIWYCEIIRNEGYWRWQRTSLGKTLNRLLSKKELSLYFFVNYHLFLISQVIWVPFDSLFIFSHVSTEGRISWGKKIIPDQHEKLKSVWEGLPDQKWQKRTSINQWKYDITKNVSHWWKTDGQTC